MRYLWCLWGLGESAVNPQQEGLIISLFPSSFLVSFFLFPRIFSRPDSGFHTNQTQLDTPLKSRPNDPLSKKRGKKRGDRSMYIDMYVKRERRKRRKRREKKEKGE